MTDISDPATFQAYIQWCSENDRPWFYENGMAMPGNDEFNSLTVLELDELRTRADETSARELQNAQDRMASYAAMSLEDFKREIRR